jgi:hypothetical protein
MKVFVLNHDKTPLMPCWPNRAHQLIKEGRASLYRSNPETIIMKKQMENPVFQKISSNFDPGSKETGIAVIVHGKNGSHVAFAMNLIHLAFP